jgi:hypothetical protein
MLMLAMSVSQSGNWSTQEFQQRHSTAQSAKFQAAANHDFVMARKYEAQAARFQSFLNRRQGCEVRLRGGASHLSEKGDGR